MGFKTGVILLKHALGSVGAVVKPRVRTLDGFFRCSLQKKALILKAFFDPSKSHFRQRNGDLYLNSTAKGYADQIQRTIREQELSECTKKVEKAKSKLSSSQMKKFYGSLS